MGEQSGRLAVAAVALDDLGAQTELVAAEVGASALRLPKGA